MLVNIHNGFWIKIWIWILDLCKKCSWNWVLNTLIGFSCRFISERLSWWRYESSSANDTFVFNLIVGELNTNRMNQIYVAFLSLMPVWITRVRICREVRMIISRAISIKDFYVSMRVICHEVRNFIKIHIFEEELRNAREVLWLWIDLVFCGVGIEADELSINRELSSLIHIGSELIWWGLDENILITIGI